MRKRNKFFHFLRCALCRRSASVGSRMGVWRPFQRYRLPAGKGLTVFLPTAIGNSENGPSVLTDTINDLEAFTSLDIKIDYADISIQPSDHYGVEYQLVA